MFLRSVKSRNGQQEYLRLVESFREGDKVKQRIVAHLGRKDLLAPHLDALIRLLAEPEGNSRWAAVEDISTPRASTWGPILVARHLFERLSLGAILDAGQAPLRHGQPLSERIFPLLANRLSRPGSEHALAQWLEDFYVCTAQGSRWVPAWKQSGRVKVSFDQLKLWYQSLDDLLAEKARIEKAVYLELRHLFSLQPDLVFYDITSTYFEGAGPAELGRFGYSRDGKPRNRQIVLGVVMMDGWPIAHHVFAGNRLDQTTVLEVVQDLNQRFALNRVVFVGDRGMMTMGNVEQLRHSKQGYLLGLQRRHRKDTFDYIQQAEASSDWQTCPVGITAAEKTVVPQTRVVEVAGKQTGVRVFVVHSEEREVYERSLRELSMEQTRKELQALKAQVEKGQLKGADKIGAAAATRLRRHHGQRYFAWELRQGKFHFFEHPTNLAREKALEGKYVLQTEERNLSPVQAVAAYKQLNQVERGFSHLKSLLELRPVYHHTDERVQAHVFVAALALLLDRALEKSLQAAHSHLSSPFAWQALETIRSVEVDLGQQRSKSCVTRGNKHASEVLRLLAITQLDPPSPPEIQKCLM
jgi:transposase